MGKRSDRRIFRRRRRRVGFALLVSLAVVAFGALLFSRMGPEGLRTDLVGNAEKVPVERVQAPEVAEAPEAVAEAEGESSGSLLAAEDEAQKTAAERERVERRADQEAAERAEAKEAAERQQAEKEQQAAAPAEIPVPATNDLWMSIPALGLYDNYVANSNDPAALDVGAAKTEESGFPWQDNANTYISAHRLGYPGTASDHQFYNLPLLQQGDVIYLGDANGTTYTYEVTGFVEVTPADTWITAPQPGRDMISLQTCIENFGDYWTMGPNWYVRYIVQADRVSVTPAG